MTKYPGQTQRVGPPFYDTHNINTIMTQDILTPAQVSDILQVNTSTLEAWRGKRIGPAWIKLGEGKRSPVRYRKTDVEVYLKACQK